jgi:hypothetical protein
MGMLVVAMVIAVLVAAVIYVASGGHVLFLPLVLLLPLGVLVRGRERRRRR